MSTFRRLGFLFLALLLLPTEGWACPVCFDTSAENRTAFLQTTVVLSLLPLGMVGGVGLWLKRRAGEVPGEVPEEEEV